MRACDTFCVNFNRYSNRMLTFTNTYMECGRRMQQCSDCRIKNHNLDTGHHRSCHHGNGNNFNIRMQSFSAVSYTHLRAHETPEHLVCRLLLEKKKKNK